MLKGIIEFEGKTYSDVEMAIVEATKWIAQEYRYGADRNDDGNYGFEIEGEEEE